MGRVFLGRHHLTGQHVAIKSLPPKYSRRKDLRERFVGEAQALARLDHENIVKMLTLLEDDDRFYLVLEYVPGEDLDELIDREGQLPIKQAVGLAGQVLGALEHAHERGVVHRDVKPGNIRIRSDGQAKLTDLGVAKLAHAARMTRFGCIVGTLHYMAPEQLRGEEVDHRSDIYAAGATFYEMLSGAVPYDAETDLALRNAQRDGPPEEVRDHRSEVPAHVAEALTKALALSPDNRFQSARDFKHALFSKPIVEEPQPEPGERTVSRAPTGRPGEARQPSGAAPAQPRSRSPRPKGTPKPPRRKAGASRKKAGAGQKPSRPKGKRRKAGKGAKPTPPPATTPAPKQAGGGGLLATAIMLVLSGLTVAVAVMLMSGPCR